MLKHKVFAIAVAIVSIAGIAGTAAPASAALRDCPANRFCLWFNSDYQGARFDMARTDGQLFDELFNDGPSDRNGWMVQVEDNAASAANRTGENVALYRDRRCRGGARILFAGEEVNLSAFLMKNQVSSVYINGGNNPDCVNINSSGF